MGLAQSRGQKGFTVVEVLVVMGIIAILIALSSINLGSPQVAASFNASVSSLVADIKSQQLLAMVGDQGSATAQQRQGVYIQPSAYVLFAGDTYNSGDTNNYSAAIGQGVTIATTLPGSMVVFEKGTGAVVGYTAGSNTITATTPDDTATITFNKFGALTVN